MPLDWHALMNDEKVLRMTNEELGAYIRLLYRAWFADEPASLPADDATLASIAQVSAQRWTELKTAVLAPFRYRSGRYHQKKMAEVYQAVLRRMQQRVESGKIGAERRYSINQLTSSPIAEPQQRHSSAFSSIPNSVQHSDSEGESEGKGFSELRAAMDGWWKRSGKAWSYIEESTAATVCQRPDWPDEWGEISRYLAAIPESEARFEQPRTMLKMLENWTGLLDRARNPVPKNGPILQPKSVNDLKTILQAKEERANAMKTAHANETPTGLEWSSNDTRAAYVTLRREIRELKERISKIA